LDDPGLMRQLQSITVALIATVAASCATGSAIDRAYLAGVEAAERQAVAFAPITDTAPETTLEEAYGLQRRLIARRVARGDRVVGYRGSLMSQASLKARNVTEPLAGALFHSGRIESGGVALLCGYRKASFELKIGYLFTRDVAAADPDIDTLRHAVGNVIPVVDLPDIAYRNPDKYSAVDMVASNISASRYVVGEEHSPRNIDLDSLRVAMTRAGGRVASGTGRESFDNQWESLAMVVRQIIKSGRRVAPGDLVITGKIGERGWLSPGLYRADYGPLGIVDFTVAACS
jgi:2-oxo-3-hexenedioate decarboxylase